MSYLEAILFDQEISLNASGNHTSFVQLCCLLFSCEREEVATAKPLPRMRNVFVVSFPSGLLHNSPDCCSWKAGGSWSIVCVRFLTGTRIWMLVHRAVLAQTCIVAAITWKYYVRVCVKQAGCSFLSSLVSKLGSRGRLCTANHFIYSNNPHSLTELKRLNQLYAVIVECIFWANFSELNAVRSQTSMSCSSQYVVQCGCSFLFGSRFKNLALDFLSTQSIL